MDMTFYLYFTGKTNCTGFVSSAINQGDQNLTRISNYLPLSFTSRYSLVTKYKMFSLVLSSKIYDV